MTKPLSILIGCYGAFPQYSIRAIESIINCDNRNMLDIYIGCNQCCQETLQCARRKLDCNNIDAIIELNYNINKDPMLRLLIDLCTTPYFLWLDDDTHVLEGWDTAILDFINNQSFDVAGHMFFMNDRSEKYTKFLRARPWWKSKELEKLPIWFATGGYLLARVEYLRQHNFPDKSMVKRMDDVLLGDLLQQQNGKLIDFGHNRGIMDKVKISNGDRRGIGEDGDAFRI